MRRRQNPHALLLLNPAATRALTMREVQTVMRDLGVPKSWRTRFLEGLEIEWSEHGGGVDVEGVASLVLDHLEEDPYYYRRAAKMRSNPTDPSLRLAHARDRADGPGPDELHVVLVDGEAIRRDLDVDFTMGGNPSRYAYVPHGELWVEHNLSIPDLISTIVHESVEHRLMKNRGMSYEDAHEATNAIDEDIRAAVDKAMRKGNSRG